MLHEFSRTELIIGSEALQVLQNSKVAIFGIGGVGTYAAEGLARSGVSRFVLVDDDAICITNINRQIHALRKTIGKSKVDAMKERILEINPKADVTTHQMFYMPENSNEINLTDCDYIIDAVDTVTAKIAIIQKAKELVKPVISAMGAGNKMDPTKFVVTDIYKTEMCPLAKVMRKELRQRGIKDLKVVYSTEIPNMPREDVAVGCRNNCVCPPSTTRKCTVRRQIPGSIAFVPSVAGLIIAGEVVKDIINWGK